MKIRAEFRKRLKSKLKEDIERMRLKLNKEKNEQAKIQIFDAILDAEFRYRYTPAPITVEERARWAASLDVVKNTRALLK